MRNRIIMGTAAGMTIDREARRGLAWLTVALTLPFTWAGEPAGALSETPLAAPSRATGRAMFTELPREQTGIDAINHYADPGMWAERYQELAYGAMGTGVTIGDYDNDGRPDVFVVSKTGPSRLFRNLGQWKFEDVTARAGLEEGAETGIGGTLRSLFGSENAASHARPNWTQGATFVDINNDGLLDLYVCRFAAPNRLYVNQGDGTFVEEAQQRGLALADASGMAAFGDYDRDGWLDVYVQTSLLDATKSPGGQRDRLYRNVGDGRFVETTEQAGIAGESMGHSATWWDFDDDGWPDLYVANDYAVPDRLYRNNGDGTFTNVIDAVAPITAFYAMGADFGDVNNDGLIDFLVGDMAATSLEKDLRGMAGSRARAQTIPDNPTAAPQLMRNALLLNTGTSRMMEAAFLAGFPATDWTWSVRFEDLDNDGRLDLHVTNGMSREYHNADLLDRIMALENPADSRRLMKESPAFRERNLAYRNLGDLRFEEVGAAWGLDHVGVSFGAAFGDLDGDGDLDLVFANYEAQPTVLRNDGADGNRVVIALRGRRSNSFGIGAKLRLVTQAGEQVRELALARGYLSSSEPVVHFGLGEEEKIVRLTVEWPSGHVQDFENLAANRRYTIVEPSADVSARAAKRERPAVQFSDVSVARGLAIESKESFQADAQPLLPVRFDRRGPALAVGDFNGDGLDDVVMGGTSAEPARVFVRSGERFVLSRTLPASQVDDGPLLAFDANGDGKIDILQSKAGTNRPPGTAYQPVLHLNDGAGGFVAVADTVPALSVPTGALAAADFDRDGNLDVFLGGRNVPGRYPTAPRSALLRNRGGRFEDVTDALAPGLKEAGMVTSALWSDVDGDGWIDLVIALEWGGVRYWRNDQGGRFVDMSEAAGFSSAGSGWWTSLASADFNGDGRMDFVAGNVGLNTPYVAPAVLFYGRFGGSGAFQIIEARQEDGRLRPLRSRSELSARLPSVARQFPKNDAYAAASIEDIVGAERLATAQRYEATQLQSGVFLSATDGRYRFVPLPRIAQIAPLQGIVTGDFDGDGHQDIYAVQNSFAPIAGIGPFAGGVSQWLRGDGRGGFEVVPPHRSGLVVPGDAKALVRLDFDADGWTDFLTTRNNGTTIAWRNGGVVGRESLQVRLRGAAGNPTGIGAQLALEFADGSRQLQELHAGSGYYSQSAAAAFFAYPETTTPRRLFVRWPDGRTTTREISGTTAGVLELSP